MPKTFESELRDIYAKTVLGQKQPLEFISDIYFLIAKYAPKEINIIDHSIKNLCLGLTDYDNGFNQYRTELLKHLGIKS